jgi:pimeloyl-ACP methyl ester carboxylesterase
MEKKVLAEKTLQAAGYKCKAIVNHSSGVPIVFLHGFSYTSEVWQRIGILDALKEKHVPFLALDMPYGPKTECHPKTHNTEPNVAFAHGAIEATFPNQIPIVVGSSIGGNIALNYASQYPVKGLLLTSPVRTFEEPLSSSLGKMNFPVHIIWGSEDHIASSEELRLLTERLPKAKLITYKGAGHSAYNDDPARFKQDLLELYARVEQN